MSHVRWDDIPTFFITPFPMVRYTPNFTPISFRMVLFLCSLSYPPFLPPLWSLLLSGPSSFIFSLLGDP